MLKEEVTEILDKLDIETYLDSQGIDYRVTHGSRGEQLNLHVCPKCGGDKWKVFINAETGLGNCFSGSCESKFNKFSFIRAYTGLSGRDLDEHIMSVGAEIGWRPPRKSAVAVHTDVKDLKLPKSFPLPIRERNLAYLENRRINLSIATYFHLRYCQKGWFKYQLSGEDKFTAFDKRIIIPIFDLDGNLVSFQGRDITGEADRKYLFPNGFASTGEHLYNGHNVHNTAKVVVGEGVFDVMATKIALDGDPELRDIVPIGTFGKHISENQVSKFLELAKRGVKEVTIMWDGEVAATDSAITAGLRLKGLGFKVRIAMLPKDCDPNEVLAEEVRRAYYGAIELTLTNAAKIKLLRRTK